MKDSSNITVSEYSPSAYEFTANDSSDIGSVNGKEKNAQHRHEFIISEHDVINWKLQLHSLKKYYNCKWSEYMRGPLLRAKHIPFELRLYPNGTKLRADEGYVNLILIHSSSRMKSLGIEQIIAYIEL